MKKILVVLSVAALLIVASGCVPVGEGAPLQEETETWSSLLPLVVPFLIMLFQQTGLSKRANGMIALGLCALAVVADGIFFYGLGSITDWYSQMGLVVAIVKKMLVEVFVV